MHKWTSAIEGIEEEAIQEWSERLDGMTGEQIKRGLESWGEDWPPSSEEFRNACLGKQQGKNEFGLDYVPECYRQPPVRDKKRLLSSDERDKRRAKRMEQFAKMKEELRSKAQ